MGRLIYPLFFPWRLPLEYIFLLSWCLWCGIFICSVDSFALGSWKSPQRLFTSSPQELRAHPKKTETRLLHRGLSHWGYLQCFSRHDFLNNRNVWVRSFTPIKSINHDTIRLTSKQRTNKCHHSSVNDYAEYQLFWNCLFTYIWVSFCRLGKRCKLCLKRTVETSWKNHTVWSQ